jgi:hypothetical protein
MEKIQVGNTNRTQCETRTCKESQKNPIDYPLSVSCRPSRPNHACALTHQRDQVDRSLAKEDGQRLKEQWTYTEEEIGVTSSFIQLGVGKSGLFNERFEDGIQSTNGKESGGYVSALNVPESMSVAFNSA